MQKSIGTIIYKNLANIVSILGVLPLCLLFVQDGYRYLIPLIVYNNIMDDLDGILATGLNIKSRFGATLDNLCDAVAHTVFVMVIGFHFLEDSRWVGGVCAALALVAVVAMVLRVTVRLDPTSTAGTGSPTNELIRHTLFLLLLAEYHSFSPVPFLIPLFAFHAVSMLVPFRMPHQIRSMAKSSSAIILVNLALIVAWLIPYVTPIIAASFIGTYLVSLTVGGVRWLNKPERDTS